MGRSRPQRSSSRQIVPESHSVVLRCTTDTILWKGRANDTNHRRSKSMLPGVKLVWGSGPSGRHHLEGAAMLPSPSCVIATDRGCCRAATKTPPISPIAMQMQPAVCLGGGVVVAEREQTTWSVKLRNISSRTHAQARAYCRESAGQHHSMTDATQADQWNRSGGHGGLAIVHSQLTQTMRALAFEGWGHKLLTRRVPFTSCVRRLC